MNADHAKRGIYGQCRYIVMFKGQQRELYAANSYAAQKLAVALLKPSKRDAGMVHVMLAETPEGPVVHTAA